MNMMKNVALMAMGGAITYAYQRYNKQVMSAVKNAAKVATGKAEQLTDQLDNMM
ncbi:unknown [Firmicutes bacterium CAG:822]|nr:unknown [Firmicutes bacterium CAG:822]